MKQKIFGANMEEDRENENCERLVFIFSFFICFYILCFFVSKFISLD